ncbi:Mediator of RNA polymerase II transcription subunit 1 [Coniochaeta hoffmannii]|uniref:Mediator of RNA polymerase II transcription subunit 1 n=1 Tax=Coniochaeta hoffmannii TaxID=91930 RepID=A0AA38SCX6_9PEZI|nr:Mediator of RNA polymerase II transcription subunit 1 [Coniochaeta hoffmannii]
MATPMKQAPSQQGKTPSQSQHGAAATPPVSTPFSTSMAGQTGLTPHGPRSSPQQFKKSPANSITVMGHPGSSAVNFDSPSAAAALGALGMAGLDMNLDGVGGLGGLGSLGRNDGDDRARRLQTVIAILSQSKGLVSEAGLERLVKRLGMECMWEDDMGGGGAKPRTLIVAGSAIELLVAFLNDAVQSVSLAFPESADVVAKHAEEAGKILLDDLKLAPGQNPLTKRLDRFAANFEMLATLDKLSVIPGLNLFEAIGGIYESLERLYRWDLHKVREDPTYNGRNDHYISNTVLCTRNGRPVMHTRGRVGLSLDYWKEKRLLPAGTEAEAAYIQETEKTWGVLISCAPLKDLSIPPVRVSDKWVSMEVEKVNGPEDIQPGSVIDWLQPENTILQPSDPSKPDPGGHGLGADALLLGPKFPEVIFKAILDPPLHVPVNVWDEIRQRGGALPSAVFMAPITLDSLLFPVAPGTQQDPDEPRSITVSRKVDVCTASTEAAQWSQTTHRNRLWIYRPVIGKTLTEIPFSHPQQIIGMLPLLRQYAFLSTILQKEFGPNQAPSAPPAAEGKSAETTATTTYEDDYEAFMAGSNEKETYPSAASAPGLNVDVNFTTYPVPRLNITFPFQQRTASVTLEIQANGQVHVESQNVLDECNSTAPDGRQRRPEDLGKMLEVTEDIGEWLEFIRTRWA